MNECINVIVKFLKEQGKQPTYDNVYYMLKAIVMFISGQSRGMDIEYLNIADTLVNNNFFRESELKTMTSMRITHEKNKEKTNQITSAITERIIDKIARRRKVNIKVNSKWFDGLQELKVVHEGAKGDRIYRWNPEDKNTLTRTLIRPESFPEVGEYVNLTEVCMALQKSITDRYPTPETIYFQGKDGFSISLSAMIKSLALTFFSEAINYGGGYNSCAAIETIQCAMCSEKPLRRNRNGLANGLYVRKDLLDEYLSNYKIEVSGYSKPEDKPKQKKK